MAGNCDWCVDAGVHVGGMGTVRGWHSLVSRVLRSASLKGVYARLRWLWESGALQTRDLREGGVRNDPGSAAHHFALARFMLRRARDTRWLELARISLGSMQNSGYVANVSPPPQPLPTRGRGADRVCRSN
jgi:hypothetical protein